MSNIPKAWEVWPGLAASVKKSHGEAGTINGPHGWDHDIRVAQTAVVVAWDEDKWQAVLAGAAGLLHSSDRILERLFQIKSGNISDVPSEKVLEAVQQMIDEHMPLLCDHDRRLVIDAVVHHGSKPNHPDDSLVTIALADADRLVNMEPDVAARGGQHHPDIPVVDPIYIGNTPGATYRNPPSVLWDVWNTTTWASDEGPYIIRLPKAREMAKTRARFIHLYLDTIKEFRAEIGILGADYPLV